MKRKAIETRYKGHRFRSRIEARWAVFYDALGVSWEYEREGFLLGPIGNAEWEEDDKHGELAYLPDFWLPMLDSWIEIKGEKPSALEILKCARLSQATGKDVYIFFGPIPTPFDSENLDIEEWSDSAYKIFAGDIGMDNYHAWCECLRCGAVGIEYNGYADRLRCRCGGDKHSTVGAPRLASAYEKAHAARFEHGEGGAQ